MSKYASIDIGSNSIRMLIAEANPSAPFEELATDRQVVRLGAGVFSNGRVLPQSIVLGLQVLRRMADKIALADVVAVRAVGTSALRDALNRQEFLEPAADILKTPVEVITGLEEARLIHLGVQLRWPHPKQRLLVLDIGGGSAELVLSSQGRFEEAISKPLGAVRLTEMFLKSDPPDVRELARMEKYVQERLAGVATRFGTGAVDRMVATSSTASALVCAANRIPRSRREKVDRMTASAAQIRRLYQELAVSSQSQRNKIVGIGPRRSEIIIAGAAVMHMVMRELGIRRMYYSTAGLREGIVADLVQRKVGLEQARLDPDQRRMVRAMVTRYGINAPHVRKVADLAHMLFESLRHVHQLPLAHGKLLDAAAHLYNIGHFVNEARHHRHSMYLVANSDMPGFSARERLVIANLCRYHRKSMPNATHEAFQMLGLEDRRAVTLLTPLLRVAVALDQSQEQKVASIETGVNDHAVELRLFAQPGIDVDIEQWSAQQTGPVFQSVYGRSLAVRTKK
jgi:exopolyphosphatase/guanosine-5'-triphosphate,3'-diphosphate pyrophosphatase